MPSPKRDSSPRPRIMGSHFVLYSTDAQADRAFLRDMMGFRYVDAHDDWLIFALPPAELGVHPIESDDTPASISRIDDPDLMINNLYLMCNDVRGYVNDLTSKGVKCGRIREESWGIHTTFQLPSGGKLGLYQPHHPLAIDTQAP